jgi:hypothetical protein
MTKKALGISVMTLRTESSSTKRIYRGTYLWLGCRRALGSELLYNYASQPKRLSWLIHRPHRSWNVRDPDALKFGSGHAIERPRIAGFGEPRGRPGCVSRTPDDACHRQTIG